MKSLIWFDTETTGLNIVLDRIVQIGAVKVTPEGNEETKNVLINPDRPIPQEATDIHGITNEMVSDKPKFSYLANSMLEWFRGCDMGGHNVVNFDIPVLAEEFSRCNITFPDESVNFVDTLKIERVVNSHNLESCYERYTGFKLTDAHDAIVDAQASKHVFYGQELQHGVPENRKELELFSNDGKERVDFAGKLIRNDEGVICFAFGNSKGVPVKEDIGFAKWILSKDFSTNTKNWIRTILKS